MWQVFFSRQSEEQSQQIWAGVENCKSLRCQEQEAWKQFAEDRHSTWPTPGQPGQAQPHPKWLPARSVTTASRSSLCPLPPRDEGQTCVPSVHNMLDSNPGARPCRQGWNSLASFTVNSHTSPLSSGYPEPAKPCFTFRVDFWQNSPSRTLALTEVNGYHLATLGSSGLIFLALIFFLLLAQENSAFALYLVIQEPECPWQPWMQMLRLQSPWQRGRIQTHTGNVHWALYFFFSETASWPVAETKTNQKRHTCIWDGYCLFFLLHEESKGTDTGWRRQLLTLRKERWLNLPWIQRKILAYPAVLSP